MEHVATRLARAFFHSRRGLATARRGRRLHHLEISRAGFSAAWKTVGRFERSQCFPDYLQRGAGAIGGSGLGGWRRQRASAESSNGASDNGFITWLGAVRGLAF